MPVERGENIIMSSDNNNNNNNNNDNDNDIRNERTPLLSTGGNQVTNDDDNSNWKVILFNFLEAKSHGGKIYQKWMIVLIIINVLAFILSTLFVEEYNPVSWANRYTGICQNTCDLWLFGNYRDNGLSTLLNMDASTSILEVGTVIIFTIDYLLRLYTANLINPMKYSGIIGRIYWIPTFFSIVDLISIIPFYVDAYILRHSDITGTSFIRMFRLLRMMKIEGRYDTALTMVDDVYQQQKSILLTALFVGITTWIAVSSLYYLAERTNINFIYCPACPDIDKDSYCNIDTWGIVNCTGDTCFDSYIMNHSTTGTEDANNNPCYNLYESIPSSSYYSLLNLFGEFPHVTDHSNYGKIIATLTTVVAVAVFALPVGIIGNGFEKVIEIKRKKEKLLLNEQSEKEQQNNNEPSIDDYDNQKVSLKEKDLQMTPNYIASSTTFRGRVFNLIHSETNVSNFGLLIDYFINFLIVATSIAFMIETTSITTKSLFISHFFDIFEFIAVIIFTIEYVFRLYSCIEDPKYNNGQYIKFIMTFLALVDLCSFLPYWIQKIIFICNPKNNHHNWLLIGNTSNDTISIFISSLRLLRILRFERYTHAFTTFDDVFNANVDILAVTAFTAILCWVFFSTILYISERDNINVEMSSNYNTIPNSMWMTLLNLSGEAPLSEYSIIGKIVTAILGLFATGIFGIPIGVLGAGFEAIVAEENQDDTKELETDTTTMIDETMTNVSSSSTASSSLSSNISTLEQNAYNFVNGIGSKFAQQFEISIYVMIFIAVGVGCWQTVDGEENAFNDIEWFAVIIFTIEYIIRFIGASADPLFSKHNNNWLLCRFHYMISFYSIIDLLAIVPFYLSVALPNSFVNEYDEYLRMLRIIRLVKLDKYVPSITLVDDVFRLKFRQLRVAFYAAVTLWALFASAMFLCEHEDTSDGIDPVPKYGCDDNCTMSDRFQNYFDSMYYTGIHLTGDYPITTYTWPARFICFFMVIAAVGVVSVPSGLIASGFVEIVKTRNRSNQPIPGTQAGDDWYEVQYRALADTEPTPSRFGPAIDAWQIAVNEYLNGKRISSSHHEWTTFSYSARIFIFFVIIANVLAVLLESIPTIDKRIGNEPGNFFDVFEFVSVMIFASEYIMRLFCAPKNREALYSTMIYATTFFGIVDFLSTAPWFIEQALLATNIISSNGDYSKIFRIFRIFRILQLEDFLTAFSKLDNVFRASKDVLKATGLLALIIWVGCGALFFIFEENNPNWRQCSDDIPPYSDDPKQPGCFDFNSTKACNQFYPGMCQQQAFTDMPNTLYYTAVFLGGEWGVVDFTWPGRMVALFLCVVGIGLYAIPVGTLFDSFGAVLGLAEEEDEEEEEEPKEKEE